MNRPSIILAGALLLVTAAAKEPPPGKLVVHEWGVLGVGLVDGKTAVLGATDRFLESLPDFVLRNELLSPNKFVEQPQLNTVWKPVIHLYGDEGQQVEIRVKVAKGYPIVYYPKPDLQVTSIPTVNDKGLHGTMTFAQSMIWKFRLAKNNPGNLAATPKGHWWNAVRQVPSDYVLMDEGAGSERFLFYEGSTLEKPTVSASVSENLISIKNSDAAQSAPVILLINDKGSHSGIYLESIAAGAQVELAAEKFQPWDENTLIANCRKQWEACGMTPEEAVGIVDSWRRELLDVPGFLLISRLPEPLYERIFPITVTPQPAELERACFVFDTLAHQDDRKHWLPVLAKQSRAIIAALAADEFKQRMEARRKLTAGGELMMPFVNEVLARANGDPESRIAASNLRRFLTDSPVCSHPLPERVPLRVRAGFLPRALLPQQLLRVPEIAPPPDGPKPDERPPDGPKPDEPKEDETPPKDELPGDK